MNHKLLLLVAVFLLIMPTAQAYFISPRVGLFPSQTNVTYFFGDYVSNNTMVYPDKILLDGTWVVMHSSSAPNVTIIVINSTYQHYDIENHTQDINITINISGWDNNANVTIHINDSLTDTIRANGSGWVNWWFNNLNSDTTKLVFQGENITITEDITPPDGVGFLLPTPSNDTNLTQNNYFINVSFNDTYPDWCELEFTIDTVATNHTMTQGANSTEYYYNATSLTNNMTSFIAYCNDTSGNWGNSSTRSVNISVSVPLVPPTPAPPISGGMIEEGNIRVNIVTGKVEIEDSNIRFNLITGKLEVLII